jgi:hypothetical protein
VWAEAIGVPSIAGIAAGFEDGTADAAADINDTINNVIGAVDVDTSAIEVPAMLATATDSDIEVTKGGAGYSAGAPTDTASSSSTVSQSSFSFDGLFNGATININNGDDVEALAEKLYTYMKMKSMGLGVG